MLKNSFRNLSLLSIGLFFLGCTNVVFGQAQYQIEINKAEQGNRFSQYTLGLMYKRGDGVSKDLKQSCGWFEKAALQEDQDAMFELYRCYLLDGGYGSNPDEAKKWLLLAAKSKPISNGALLEISNNLSGQYKGNDLQTLINNGIATQEDLDKTIAAMRANKPYAKIINTYDAYGIQVWGQANDYVIRKNITFDQALNLIKKEQDTKILEANKQIEASRRLEAKAKADQEMARLAIQNLPQYSVNAANSPIRARVGSVYESGWNQRVKYLYLQSKANDLLIEDIELNRGNCKNVKILPAYFPQFPFTLQFGDTARVILDMGGSVFCDLLEAKIRTNKGVFFFD